MKFKELKWKNKDKMKEKYDEVCIGIVAEFEEKILSDRYKNYMEF